ncbi:FtsX-like permease family protein [Shewanella sp.]|uniref:FtsX-like permease family protein n=1 Tax=Shewanella sp. TaxID=50422 RepID=UPI0035692FDF
MFDVFYGLRKWRGQYTQLALLIVGMGLFTALLSAVFQLYSELNKYTPNWVNNNNTRFITVGRSDINQGFTTISAKELARLDKMPQVDEVGLIGFRSQNITLGEQSIGETGVAFYSHNLANMLSLPSPFVSIDMQAQDGAFISHDFWQTQLGGRKDYQGLLLKIKDATKQWTVRGVLPPQMDAIGMNHPNIWLPKEAMSHLTFVSMVLPDSMPDSEKRAMKANLNKTVMQNLPLYYAIAKLHGPVDLQTLTDSLNSKEQSEQQPQGGGNVSFTVKESEKKIAVVDGIEFNPSQKRALKQQWLLLLVLLFGLMAVNAFNLLSVNSSRLVSRANEFSLRIALGGRPKDFVAQLLLESIPMILFTVILGMFFNYAIQVQMLNNPIYEQFFGGKTIPFEFATWFMTLVLLSLFICLCSIMPLLLMLKNSHFSRARTQTLGKGQSLATKTNVIIQISIALFAVTIATTMTLNEWHKRSLITVNKSLVTIKVSSDDALPLTANIKSGAFADFDKNDLAITSQPFVSPGDGFPTISLPEKTEQSPIVVRELMVTDNFITFFGLSLLTPIGELSEHSVIINRSAADLLIADGQYEKLIGQKLQLQRYSDPVRMSIIGVIDNPPHFGVENSDTPFIYTNLSELEEELTDTLYLTTQPKFEQRLFGQIKHWSDNELVKGQVEKLGDIEHGLTQLDKTARLLFMSAVFLSTLVCLLVLLSIYHQIKAHLELHVISYGTKLAVGASALIVRLEIVAGLFVLFLLAMPLSLLLSYSSRMWFLQTLSIEIFSAPVALLSMTIIALIVLLAGYLPAKSLTSRPIAQLLRFEQ